MRYGNRILMRRPVEVKGYLAVTIRLLGVSMHFGSSFRCATIFVLEFIELFEKAGIFLSALPLFSMGREIDNQFKKDLN